MGYVGRTGPEPCAAACSPWRSAPRSSRASSCSRCRGPRRALIDGRSWPGGPAGGADRRHASSTARPRTCSARARGPGDDPAATHARSATWTPIGVELVLLEDVDLGDRTARASDGHARGRHGRPDPDGLGRDPDTSASRATRATSPPSPRSTGRRRGTRSRRASRERPGEPAGSVAARAAERLTIAIGGSRCRGTLARRRRRRAPAAARPGRSRPRSSCSRRGPRRCDLGPSRVRRRRLRARGSTSIPAAPELTRAATRRTQPANVHAGSTSVLHGRTRACAPIGPRAPPGAHGRRAAEARPASRSATVEPPARWPTARPRRPAPRVDLESLREPLLGRAPRRTTRRPTSSPVERAFDLAVEAHATQKRASGEPYVTHPIASAQILAELGHRPGRGHRGAAPRRPRGHRVQPGRRRGALRRRGRPPRRRRHQAVEVQHPQPRAAAGREHPQDVPGDGRGHPGRPHQARRPAPQHAHAGRAARREAAADRPRDDGDLRAAGGAARDLADQVGARGPRVQGARARALPRARQAPRHAAQGPRELHRARDRELRPKLEAAGIEADLQGRPKHIYSIWKKMQRKGAEFDEIYDVYAIRVLVDEVRDCYAALGIVHSLWRPIPGQFDDYIAMPKDSLYQSLHTAVIALDGKPLEIQIRTHEMHQVAEYGIAAHWRYKEGSKSDREYDAKLAWLRQLMDWQREVGDAHGVRRGHQARHLPGPGLRLHAARARSRSCRPARRRSTSPTASTPTSATARSARRSTTGSCRSTTGCGTATSSRSSPPRPSTARRATG